jgi:hypothetical protein
MGTLTPPNARAQRRGQTHYRPVPTPRRHEAPLAPLRCSAWFGGQRSESSASSSDNEVHIAVENVQERQQLVYRFAVVGLIEKPIELGR